MRSIPDSFVTGTMVPSPPLTVPRLPYHVLNSLDEDTPFGRPDLEVEVAQEVHPQHAIDSVAEISNVHVHVRNGEPDRGELRNANDIAAFLRYCRTHDAASNSVCRGIPDRFGNGGNQSG